MSAKLQVHPGEAQDTGNLAVTSSLVLIAVLQIGGRMRGGIIQLTNAGAAALTHFKLTRSNMPSGHDTGQALNWLVDTDLDTPDAEMPAATSGIQTLAAGASAFIHLDLLEGVQEIGIYAQCGTSTSLRVTASFGAPRL